jgi:hypothetical protein
VRQAFHWISRGCEVGMYPYVVPFSGAAMARDPTLDAHTQFETVTVPGTAVSWRQATKILPIDPAVRSAVLSMEERFDHALEQLRAHVPHLPSRVRSLLWIACAEATLRDTVEALPAREEILASLLDRLPAGNDVEADSVFDTLAAPTLGRLEGAFA